jgi:hypothetical protein
MDIFIQFISHRQIWRFKTHILPLKSSLSGDFPGIKHGEKVSVDAI